MRGTYDRAKALDGIMEETERFARSVGETYEPKHYHGMAFPEGGYQEFVGAAGNRVGNTCCGQGFEEGLKVNGEYV